MEIDKIILFLSSAVCSFFMLASVTLFLRGFCDSGFQWNRKKAFLFMLISIAYGAIYLHMVGGTVLRILLLLLINSLLTPLYIYIAVYDYQGKKIWGIIRFYLAYQIMTIVMMTPLTEGAMPFFEESEAIVDIYAMLESGSLTVQSYFDAVLNVLKIVMPCMAAVFCLIFLFLYHKVYKPGIMVRLRKKEIFLTIAYVALVPILGGVIFVSRNIDYKVYETILGGIAIVAFISLPILLYYSRIQAYYRERTKIQESYIESELEHFRKYKQAQEETKIFRHDIRNNLQCMHQMLSAGKVKDAEVYLAELLESVEMLSDKYVSGDEILDCVIAAKVAEMEKKHIAFSMDGVLAGGLNWKPVDICGVFANALDNAIEACQKLPEEERSIRFEIKTTSQYWFIRICNPVQQKVDTARLFKKEGGYTSKEKAENHGIGTYKMKYTVESYGGVLNAECTQQQFTLEIMMNKVLSFQQV